LQRRTDAARNAQYGVGTTKKANGFAAVLQIVSGKTVARRESAKAAALILSGCICWL
jgi:hypothetical protein